MGLLIYIPFIIRNYIRAAAAKLSGWLWALYTFLAMLVATIIGEMIQLGIMINQDPVFARMMRATQGKNWDEMMARQQQVVEYWQKKQTVFSELFIIISAIGGYLFIRHLLIKRSGGEESQA